jgi:hypothetical protein
VAKKDRRLAGDEWYRPRKEGEDFGSEMVEIYSVTVV